MPQKATTSNLQSILNTFGVVLILWSLYRFNFTGMPDWFDEFVAKPLVFILPAYIFIKKYEKRDPMKSLSFFGRSTRIDIGIGVGLGTIFLFSAIFANYIRFGSINIIETLTSSTFVLSLLITFATAISEEIFTRGFLLKRLYDEWKNVYSSAFFTSVLFLVLHIPILLANLNLSGNLLMIFFATDFVLSLVNSFVFIERRSLVASILIHALYNLAILFYL